ncbi:MAG: YajQ family cyclic di-GMP-binding protein [Gemmatimonadota bacterium]
MARMQSFDVTSTVDLQEVDNALNQARKEVSQRFDFKGVRVEIQLERSAGVVRLVAGDEYRLRALLGVVREKLARRRVPLKNVRAGKVEPAAGGASRMELSLQQGIPGEVAKQMSRAVRDLGLKRVQAHIQGDQLRVQGPDRDDLQKVIRALRERDFGLELQFGNYRSQ